MCGADNTPASVIVNVHTACCMNDGSGSAST
jgi:hypothetical protein